VPSVDRTVTETAGQYFDARLFNATGSDQVVPLDELADVDLDDTRLLWIDLTGHGREFLPQVCEAVGIGEHALQGWDEDTNPALGKHDESFWLRVVAINDEGDRRCARHRAHSHRRPQRRDQPA